MTISHDDLWNGDYKIPWNDGDFSRRMLNEHLTQDHDLASRRAEWIERQVDWIHRQVLETHPSRILDLGCGPGLYAHRLTRMGHRCHGIDFGPASIAYAREHTPDPSQCGFVLGDLRHAAFGGPHDLAMILYGELNVFAPDEISAILGKARASLAPGGRMIAEVQAPQAVERMGRAEPSERELASGLFSDRPHRWRTESRWLADLNVAVQVFTITETSGEPPRIYRSTTKAWSDDDLRGLFLDVGLAEPSRCDGWPGNTDDLALWTAMRP